MIPISFFIESHGIKNINIRSGDFCTGKLLDHSSIEASSMMSKLKRIEFLIRETNRIRDLLGTEFSSKSPKNVFDKVCNDLLSYSEELDSYDRTIILNEC